MCAASPGPAAPGRGAHRSRPPRRTPALTAPQRGPGPPPWPAALFVYSRPPRPALGGRGSGGGAVRAGKSSLARPRRHWPLPRWRGGKNYISQQAPQGWGGERRGDWLPSGRENYISQKAPGACAPRRGWAAHRPSLPPSRRLRRAAASAPAAALRYLVPPPVLTCVPSSAGSGSRTASLERWAVILTPIFPAADGTTASATASAMSELAGLPAWLTAALPRRSLWW